MTKVKKIAPKHLTPKLPRTNRRKDSATEVFVRVQGTHSNIIEVNVGDQRESLIEKSMKFAFAGMKRIFNYEAR